MPESPDFSPDPTEEYIWVAHENPDILPAKVTRAALECEGGMAERGWYETDEPEPVEADAEELSSKTNAELLELAQSRGIDTVNTNSTKADLVAALTEEN